jgi:hypothetical protein
MTSMTGRTLMSVQLSVMLGLMFLSVSVSAEDVGKLRVKELRKLLVPSKPHSTYVLHSCE